MSNRLALGLRATGEDGDEDDGAFSDDDAYEEYEELVRPHPAIARESID